jgi:hypothetical protein
MLAQVAAWVAPASAEEPSKNTGAQTSRGVLRRSLREFDRFLDHHPLLENQLRLNPQLVTADSFLKENLELRDFLHANPNAIEGLKIYPRYFLHRALIRLASGPLSFRDLAPIDELFLQSPKLEEVLTRKPELIRDPAFLESNAVLRDCLIQHAVLARVFLGQSETK